MGHEDDRTIARIVARLVGGQGHSSGSTTSPGQRYVPDQKVRFPFLQIEFKSQAKIGTHYIETNQAAGTGAIALSGNMDLHEGDRSSYQANISMISPES